MRQGTTVTLTGVVLLAGLAAGCGGGDGAPGGGPGASLPSEDNLFAYSLAIAERMRQRFSPDWYLPLFNVGRVHKRFGKDEKALEIFRQALGLDPDAAEVYREIGTVYSLRKNRMADAVAALQRALELDSSQSGLRNQLGILLTHQDRLEEAEKTLQQEIRQGDPDAMTYYCLAQAYRLERKHGDAVKYYRKAIARSASMREALYGLSQSLRALGKGKEAAEALARFRALRDREEENVLAARRADKQFGIAHERRYAASTWIDAAGVLTERLLAERDESIRQKLSSEVLHAVNEALRFDPKLRMAYDFLVRFHKQRHDHEKVVDIMRRMIDVFPDDPRLHFDFAGLLIQDGVKASASGGIDQGLAHLEKALEIYPEFSAAHRELARAILFHRRRPELLPAALEHARKAVDTATDPGPADYELLSMAYYVNHDTNAARRVLREAVRLFPDNEKLRLSLRRFEELAR